ncbi:MAG: hypothetical protein ACFFBD_28560, partial [Candidatus Hodarchaeota archaeon]
MIRVLCFICFIIFVVAAGILVVHWFKLNLNRYKKPIDKKTIGILFCPFCGAQTVEDYCEKCHNRVK